MTSGVTGDEVRKKRGADTTNMEITSWAWGKTSADCHNLHYCNRLKEACRDAADLLIAEWRIAIDCVEYAAVYPGSIVVERVDG